MTTIYIFLGFIAFCEMAQLIRTLIVEKREIDTRMALKEAMEKWHKAKSKKEDIEENKKKE